MIKSKRGLSPVIATTLLVALVLILAVIIFLWARSFVTENIQKDIGGGAEPVENFCELVNFGAEAKVENGDLIVEIVNQGNVPIYGLVIKKVDSGGISVISDSNQERSISPGGGERIDFGASGVSPGDEIVIAPKLLGESNSNKVVHNCGEESEKSVFVG